MKRTRVKQCLRMITLALISAVFISYPFCTANTLPVSADYDAESRDGITVSDNKTDTVREAENPVYNTSGDLSEA